MNGPFLDPLATVFINLNVSIDVPGGSQIIRGDAPGILPNGCQNGIGMSFGKLPKRRDNNVLPFAVFEFAARTDD